MFTQEKFPRRHNPNGTLESFCRRCLAKIATVDREEDLRGLESRHSCDPVQVYRVNQGRIVLSSLEA